MRRRNIDGYSADSLSRDRLTIDRLSTDYRPTIDRLSSDYRATVDRLSTATSTDRSVDTTYSKQDPISLRNFTVFSDNALIARALETNLMRNKIKQDGFQEATVIRWSWEQTGNFPRSNWKEGISRDAYLYHSWKDSKSKAPGVEQSCSKKGISNNSEVQVKFASWAAVSCQNLNWGLQKRFGVWRSCFNRNKQDWYQLSMGEVGRVFKGAKSYQHGNSGVSTPHVFKY